MPGYDGTGPRGTGPMTGGGRGYCAVPAGRTGVGTVEGRPWGRGGGRGWRNMYYATGMTGWQRAGLGYPAYGGRAYPNDPGFTAEEEKEMLKNEAEALKRELEEVQQRISLLEKERENGNN